MYQGYDTLDEWLMDRNMTMEDYRKELAKRKSRIAGMRTWLDRQQRKEKQMEKTPTFTVKKRDNAPDFVFGYFGCKFEDLKKYVNSKGYVNFDILQSKEGGYYVKVSDYGLTTDTVAQGTVTESDTVLNFDDEEIPF